MAQGAAQPHHVDGTGYPVAEHSRILIFLSTPAFRSSDIPQLSMASTEFSLEVVKESLSKETVFYLEDLAVGEGILKMGRAEEQESQDCAFCVGLGMSIVHVD